MNEDELNSCFLKMKSAIESFIEENKKTFPRSENWHLYLVNFHEIQEILKIVFSDSGQNLESRRYLFLSELTKRIKTIFNYKIGNVPTKEHKVKVSEILIGCLI